MKVDLTKEELGEIIYSFSCVEPWDCDELHFLVLEKLEKFWEKYECQSN